VSAETIIFLSADRDFRLWQCLFVEQPVGYLPIAPGEKGKALPDSLKGDFLVELLNGMIVLRAFDERAVRLQRQGRIGNYPPCWGEEGAQVGPLFACDDADWIFPSYRQQALPILRGVEPATILRYRRGIGGPLGFWAPREHRCAPISISIATHLPHAVGLAWAAKLKGDPVCSLVWFGDGATSEGDFHEAMNFAAVFKTPTIFFCTNNQWAISTPFERQTASKTISEKAAAYGMPGIRVDGFDVIACWAAVRDALERARDGGGPTLIEGVTYRIGPHATADDPSRYRDDAVAARWKKSEPIGRLSAFLKSEGIIDPEVERRLLDDARKRIDDAVEEMESTPVPGPEVLFETTYASGMPWTLEEGLTEFNR
jgi:pyruvate dehydrogenase E1 component alpha subunit